MQDPRSYILYNLRKTSAFCHSRTPSVIPAFFLSFPPPFVIPAQAGIQTEWIPHQVRDDKKECGSPIRSASLSVEDGKGVCHSRPPSVIPAQAGIQSFYLDPQSSWG